MRHESQFFYLREKCNIIAINSCFAALFSSSVVFPHNVFTRSEKAGVTARNFYCFAPLWSRTLSASFLPGSRLLWRKRKSLFIALLFTSSYSREKWSVVWLTHVSHWYPSHTHTSHTNTLTRTGSYTVPFDLNWRGMTSHTQHLCRIIQLLSEALRRGLQALPIP